MLNNVRIIKKCEMVLNESLQDKVYTRFHQTSATTLQEKKVMPGGEERTDVTTRLGDINCG